MLKRPGNSVVPSARSEIDIASDVKLDVSTPWHAIEGL
jgi:hypothetical protein